MPVAPDDWTEEGVVMEDLMYAWQVQEADGRWGNISAMIGGLGHAVAIARSPEVAAKLEPIARAHRAGTGKPVRLAVYALQSETALTDA